MTTPLRLGELCAGYGGLGMAVEEVFGATSAWFSEFDDAPSKILAHHWPEVPNYGDMTKIDWAAIEPVDIISGGTPCQDLSAAGRRAGMTEGTRSNLWVQMREAIAIQRPKYVVWENVRGAYSAAADSDLEHCPGCMGDPADRGTVLRALGRVLGDLSDLGYDVQWRGLRAADVGAPHGRFRVFVLARRRDAIPDAGRFGRDQAIEHDGRHAPTNNGAGLPNEPGRDAHGAGPIGGPTVAEDADIATGGEWRITAPGQAESGRPWADAGGRDRTLTPDPSSARRGEGEDSGTSYCYACKRPWGIEPERVSGERVSETTAYTGHDGRNRGPEPDSESEANGKTGERRGHADGRGLDPERLAAWGHDSAVGETNWGDYESAIRRWEARLGRSAPRPTEPTGRDNGERLSPRFTEWMMGLPDGWVTDPAISISRNEQLKACGNGVVPQQAMAALRDMLAAFEQVAT